MGENLKGRIDTLVVLKEIQAELAEVRALVKGLAEAMATFQPAAPTTHRKQERPF